RLPLRRLGRDLLRLLRQGGLASDRFGPGGLARGPDLGRLLHGDDVELIQARGDTIEVADGVHGVQGSAQAAQAGDGGGRGGGTTGEPSLKQVYLGDQIVESTGEVRQSLLERPGLPGAHHPLPGRRLDVYRPVLVDPTEARPIAPHAHAWLLTLV